MILYTFVLCTITIPTISLCTYERPWINKLAMSFQPTIRLYKSGSSTVMTYQVILAFYTLLANPSGLPDVSGEGACHRALIIDSFHRPDIGRDTRNIPSNIKLTAARFSEVPQHSLSCACYLIKKFATQTKLWRFKVRPQISNNFT